MYSWFAFRHQVFGTTFPICRDFFVPLRDINCWSNFRKPEIGSPPALPAHLPRCRRGGRGGVSSPFAFCWRCVNPRAWKKEGEGASPARSTPRRATITLEVFTSFPLAPLSNLLPPSSSNLRSIPTWKAASPPLNLPCPNQGMAYADITRYSVVRDS